MEKDPSDKPSLYTVLSPALLPLYELSGSIVVIIDILRATSTVAAALHNGAKEIIPVRDVDECIKLSRQLDAISAGERDGKVARGLEYGNSPLTFTPDLVRSKTVVLTTTNGTRLLHDALSANAGEIITGAFVNYSSVCDFITDAGKNVILACSAWRDRVNLEDTLFAGAVLDKVKDHFQINCDGSMVAWNLYQSGKTDLPGFMKKNNASHFRRLMDLGHEDDLNYCFRKDIANILPVYRDGRLVIFNNG